MKPGKNQARPCSLWRGSGSNDNAQQQTERVNEHMTFAPGDVLCGIKAAHALNLCCLDALAIETSSRRVFMTMGCTADFGMQAVMQAQPFVAFAPEPKVV